MTIPTAAAVLAEARKHIGYREGRNNSNMFGEFYGANNTAWCAQFVYYCVRKAGAEKGELIRKSAWCPDFLADARAGRLDQKIIRDPAKGDRSGTPEPGDIGLVQRTRSQDSNYVNGAKHIFLVEKYLGDGYVQTLEGNTSDTGSATGNGVYRLKRKLTDQIVILRPKYKAPATPPPSGGGGGVADDGEVWHVDPAKVENFLWAVKDGKRNNIKLAPRRIVKIVRWKTDSRRTWGITAADNWISKSHLKRGKP
jgi:hypothetical protein